MGEMALSHQMQGIFHNLIHTGYESRQEEDCQTD